MKEERINKYWSEFFGIEQGEIKTKGITVVSHRHLEGYNGAWIFKRNKRIIFSVPPKMVNKIRTKIGELKPEENNLFSKSYIDYLFKNKIERIIGPIYQGYYDNAETESLTSAEVKEISYKDDQELIEQLSKSGDKEGWRNSGTNKDNEGIYGYYYKNQIVSIANYTILKGNVGFIGVYTNPADRGKGFSQEVVKRLVKELQIRNILMRYQTLSSNKASVSLANKVGFIEYGRNIAIRFYGS